MSEPLPDQSNDLRDVIAEQVNKLEETHVEPQAVPAAQPDEAKPAEVKEDRPRDDQGRFTEKPKEPAPKIEQAPIVPEVKRPQRPSSWKKEYWDQWEKLDPKLAEYINQRESDYAKGVSTYKTEYDRLKGYQDAVAPYQQILEQHRLDPVQHVGELLKTHHTLVMGSPQEKLALLQRIIQQNRIPVEQLFAQGQDGRLYFNPQIQQPAPQPQLPQPDVRQTVQEILSQEKARQELVEFEANAQEKYPHYEAVRETMVRLLDSGFSKTLAEAYEDALRQRQHADLYAQVQQAEVEKSKAEAARKAAEDAARARRNTVSPRTQTPAVKSGDGKPRSIRESIEAAVEQHASADRV